MTKGLEELRRCRRRPLAGIRAAHVRRVETIASVQAQVNAAIENRAGSDGWVRSSGARRSYERTPRSLAVPKGSTPVRSTSMSTDLPGRAADRAADSAACREAAKTAPAGA